MGPPDPNPIAQVTIDFLRLGNGGQYHHGSRWKIEAEIMRPAVFGRIGKRSMTLMRRQTTVSSVFQIIAVENHPVCFG